MVFDRRFYVAVIAVDPSFCVLKLGRHRLTFDRTLKMPELHFHVNYATAADRTTVRSFHMLVIASMMDAMATTHEDDSLWGRKHVLAAYRTVAVRRAFDTAMSLPDTNRKTYATSLYSRQLGLR